MKTLLNNAVSLFKHGVGRFIFDSGRGSIDELVAGYSPQYCADYWNRGSDRLPRRRVGILYADIADYSRLTEHDEEGTHRRLVLSLKR